VVERSRGSSTVLGFSFAFNAAALALPLPFLTLGFPLRVAAQ
jgi:hypothetical protein